LDKQVQVGFLNQLGDYFSTTTKDSFYVSFKPVADFSQLNNSIGGTSNYKVMIHSVIAGVDTSAQVGTFAVQYSAGSFFKSNLFMYDRLEAVMGPKPATANDVYLYSLKINGVDLFPPSATAFVFSNPGLRSSTAVYQGVGHDVRDSIIRLTTTGGAGSTDVEYQNFRSIMPVPEPGALALMLLSAALVCGCRRRYPAERTRRDKFPVGFGELVTPSKTTAKIGVSRGAFGSNLDLWIAQFGSRRSDCGAERGVRRSWSISYRIV
jgi:PEP-CTERM motif